MMKFKVFAYIATSLLPGFCSKIELLLMQKHVQCGALEARGKT